MQLTDGEISRLAAFKKLSEVDFIQRFTRLTADRRGLALMERPDGECVFLDGNDCSATGLSFRHDAPLGVGTMLKVKLVFNSLPKIMLDSVGVVVRSESRVGLARHPDHYDMGILFTHIHEADR